MTTRRTLLIALGTGAAALSIPALAQQEKRVRRIGYLSGGSTEANAAWIAAFRAGMLALRWVDGRDYVIDARYANGVPQAMDALSAELVANHPDVLMTPGDDGVRAFSQRTKTLPIVFATGQDPVGNGLVASLRQPGGNTTGLTSMTLDLAAKRLQLLKEAFPRVARVVMLFDSRDRGTHPQVKLIEEAAKRLRMRVTPIGLGQSADIEPAFNRGTVLGAHAYMVAAGFFINTQRQAIADLIRRSQVPAMFEDIPSVEAGGLMSYSASREDNFRRAAGYVDKILKGANPGDLPVEQPTLFELVVNMKTAKAMGLTFPQSFLIRVERVIE